MLPALKRRFASRAFAGKAPQGCAFGMGPEGRHTGFPGPLEGSSAMVVGGGMKI